MTETVTVVEAPAYRGRGRVLDGIGLLARLVLGITLLIAGGLKVTNPTASAQAVHAFEILPWEVGTYVGYGLPLLEIIVGALLVLGLFTRMAAVVGTLLMVAFIIGIVSVWVRGISIDCGCFGGGGKVDAGATRYLWDTVRDSGLAACGLWLVARPRSWLALDRMWD